MTDAPTPSTAPSVAPATQGEAEGLVIYGIPQSRAYRPLWVAHELGIPYRLEPVSMRDGAALGALRPVNPNAKIPAITDDGAHFWESMALTWYLVRKHGGPLAPQGLAEETRTLQWTLWVVTEVEKTLLDCLAHRALMPEDQRDATRADQAAASLEAAFLVLNEALTGRNYLVADRFMLADLNVAAVLSWAKPARISLAAYPALDAWLSTCLKRPAARSARQG